MPAPVAKPGPGEVALSWSGTPAVAARLLRDSCRAMDSLTLSKTQACMYTDTYMCGIYRLRYKTVQRKVNLCVKHLPVDFPTGDDTDLRHPAGDGVSQDSSGMCPGAAKHQFTAGLH